MPVKDKVKAKVKKAVKKRNQRKPIWDGLESNTKNGGITQSLLSRFLVCKERFRILTIEGLTPTSKRFFPATEYGSMWHICEEAYADGKDWHQDLREYAKVLMEKYPTEQSEVEKWFLICQAQFPLYIDYWKDHEDVKNRSKPLLQEESFRVPYKLPSGRVVYLRGKWDSVDLVGTKNKKSIWLQENKTKGRIDEHYITHQLTFDLQTMIYLIALIEYQKNEVLNWRGYSIKGVRYNVIRRTGMIQRGGRMVNAKDANGKTIKDKNGNSLKERQGQESNTQFAERVVNAIKENPDDYFMRWNVEVFPGDIVKFKEQFLDPCLEHLCMWYDYQTDKDPPELFYEEHYKFLHYRLPYGVYNSILEGRGSDIENYLLTGSIVGLKRVKTLFGELE